MSLFQTTAGLLDSTLFLLTRWVAANGVLVTATRGGRDKDGTGTCIFLSSINTRGQYYIYLLRSRCVGRKISHVPIMITRDYTLPTYDFSHRHKFSHFSLCAIITNDPGEMPIIFLSIRNFICQIKLQKMQVIGTVHSVD